MGDIADIGVAGPKHAFDPTEFEAWEKVEDFVDGHVTQLEARIQQMETQLYQIREIDLTSNKLKAILRQRGAREWTINELREAWLEATKPDRDAAALRLALSIRATRKSDSLQYYVVVNRPGNRIHILAEDPEAARYIAWCNNRITGINNGKVLKYSAEAIENLKWSDSIKKALKEGRPGIIKIMDDHVIHTGMNHLF